MTRVDLIHRKELGMTWTRSTPRESGYYWCRSNGNVEIVLYDKDRALWHRLGVETDPDEDMADQGYEWQAVTSATPGEQAG